MKLKSKYRGTVIEQTHFFITLGIASGPIEYLFGNLLIIEYTSDGVNLLYLILTDVKLSTASLESNESG